MSGDDTVRLIKSGLHRLISAEPEITAFNRLVGEGDWGLYLESAAEAVLAGLPREEDWTDVVQVVGRLAQVVESNMDGCQVQFMPSFSTRSLTGI